MKTSEIKMNRKDLFYKVGLIICSTMLFLLFFTTLIILFVPTLIIGTLKSPNTFFLQKTYTNKSPNGKFEIDVFRKVNFPANEFLDPAITVYVSLRNVEKNYIINSVQFGLREISDLEEPEITWTPNGVRIDNIDTDKQFAFDLRLPDYLRQN